MHKNACTQKMEPKCHKRRKMGDKNSGQITKLSTCALVKKATRKEVNGTLPTKKTQKNTAGD